MKRKLIYIIMAVVMIFTACFLLVSCNVEPQIPTETSPVEDAPTDQPPIADLNETFDVIADYTYRYGEQYYVRTEINVNGQPLREEYYLFATMGLDFSVIYTYSEQGKAENIIFDYRERTLQDDKIEPEYDENSRLLRLSRYRKGEDVPSYDIVFERYPSGKLKKETRYEYGIEVSYAEYGEDGRKCYEKGRAKSIPGTYEMRFEYSADGSVTRVDTSGYNYEETLFFEYTESGKPTRVLMRRGGRYASTGVVFDVFFNEDGRCIYLYNEIYERSGREYKYIYDGTGVQYLTSYVTREETIEHEYNGEFALTCSKFSESTSVYYTEEYEYDSLGFIIKMTKKVYRYGGPKHTEETVYMYELDEHGHLIKWSDGKDKKEFDARGNMISAVYADGCTEKNFYDENNRHIRQEYVIPGYNDIRVTTVTENDDSRVTVQTFYSADGIFRNRNIITQKRVLPDGIIAEESVSEYKE